MKAAWILAFLAVACGPHDDPPVLVETPPTLGEKLTGNWYYERKELDQGFLRTEIASLDLHMTTIHLNYSIVWNCDSIGPCPDHPPDAYGGYFEGIFQDLGDSLALQDASDTVAFRNVTDSSFTLLINGRLSFPMERQ